MNNKDNISESLETIIWVKILKFFDADPGSGMENILIREKHPGSATLVLTTRKFSRKGYRFSWFLKSFVGRSK